MAGKPVTQCLFGMAALLIACSLIFIVGLMRFNDGWVIVRDNDPATSLGLAVIYDHLAGKKNLSELDPDGDRQIPLTGGKLIKFNGSLDNNRAEPMALTGRSVILVTPPSSDPPLLIWENRAIKSYLDFGHLKVFPDASVSYTSFENYYGYKAASLHSRGVFFIFI